MWVDVLVYVALSLAVLQFFNVDARKTYLLFKRIRSSTRFPRIGMLLASIAATGLAIYSAVLVLQWGRGLRDVNYAVMVVFICFVLWSFIIAPYIESARIKKALLVLGATWGVAFIVLWGFSADIPIWARFVLVLGSALAGYVIHRVRRYLRQHQQVEV